MSANANAVDVLTSRRSARALRAPAPSDAQLQTMIESAVRAPDHGKLRPWRFIVIEGDAIAKFGDVLADHMRRARPNATDEMLQTVKAKAMRAPMIIVVAAAYNTEAKVPPVEQMLSAGAAAQNIMLSSYALGLNAMWKTGDAAYDHGVKTALGLQSSDAIVGFMYVGTQDGETSQLPTPSWKDFVRRWPAP